MPGPWWQSTVVYQVYPRSFSDGNGDGIGDLQGLLEQIDYVARLGVGAVWLSPIFRSPMADFGYDVSDYRDVDPVFGTLDDLDRLVERFHERGIRVLLDWVPNHSSIEHPWFVESRSSRTSAKRDWYVWRDPPPGGGPPNNWLAEFSQGAPAWTFDDASGQYYLHLFLPEQPDLNWANPEVVAAMHDDVRFWLDRGIDGFRIDVVHGLGKDITRDDPDDYVEAGHTHAPVNDSEATHGVLRDLRRLFDSYPDERVMVGEVFLLDTARVARYYGHGDELHLSFNFPPLFASWKASSWRRHIDTTIAHLDPIDAWPTWVLSNHDRPRHRTRYDSEAITRAAAVLLLTLRGTPFLYAGEELGLADAVVPPERVVDPGGRDGCRAPLPWTREPGHGWPSEPWLPLPPQPSEHSVEAEENDPRSMLTLYRRLIAVRTRSPALSVGDFTWLDSPEGVLAWQRRANNERWVVLVNFTETAQTVSLPGLTCEVSSDGIGEGEAVTVLRPWQAALLR
ncbi:MAG: alpha-amylase family glycosyl hydrolase [Acidimicrobiales bacterium]